jgi:hypothetical protein
MSVRISDSSLMPCSDAFKALIVLHTDDGDLNDVITMRDRTSVYGSEIGWYTEQDFKRLLNGESDGVTCYCTAEQAWEAQKAKG